MEIEKTIQELAELERHVRALDALIQHVNSMSDEELKKEWPRIQKAQRALEMHGRSLPAAKHFAGQFLKGNEDTTGFRKLLSRRLWSVKTTMKKATSFF
jgi:hypothetical protein